MIKQRKIARYVLLQIVTLGIYGLFFWSDWTEDVNKMCEDDDKESANYILVFILDIISLGIYSFVWNYTMAERMYRIAPQYGTELKYSGSHVLLLRTILFFLPVIGSVMRIKSFNALAVAYNATLDEDAIVLETMKEKKSKKQLKAEKKAAKKSAKGKAAPAVEVPAEDVIAVEAEAPVVETSVDEVPVVEPAEDEYTVSPAFAPAQFEKIEE
ncbi:MAG: DUF4234 domain-containing protein, partial [Clostridia bacterium]|nr:DUF4234 domain-containing protein [Clostridia bacterium]